MSQRQRLGRLAGLVPKGSSTAARTPFVLLVVLLLGSGMLGLLFLNASLNEGSFELSELRRETQELTDQQQELQAEVDGYSAPDALAERARELGMVPDGPPVFLGPDGSLLGDVATRAGGAEGAEGAEEAVPRAGAGGEASAPPAAEGTEDDEDPAAPPLSTPPGTIVDDAPSPGTGGAALGLSVVVPAACRRLTGGQTTERATATDGGTWS
ncbi:septum formation initiator family protein [Streptomyces sp. NPDC127098]|uniref:FtsB family cell division protein n=1 Tax=Streptomyces sp. NPDC127098 TaxID=3347137 RepID=UPI003660D0F7